MRPLSLITIGVFAAWTGTARGDGIDLHDWYRRAETLVQSVIGNPAAADREVMAPSGNIDPKMAFEPPRPVGTMRIIRPPASGAWQH